MPYVECCDHCESEDEESGVVLTVWEQEDLSPSNRGVISVSRKVQLCGSCLSRLIPLGRFTITESLDTLLSRVDKGY